METWTNKIEAIALGIVIGDALGSAFNGISRAHISASGESSHDYPDISNLIKRDTRKWRRSGLYSSISQIMLINALSIRHNKINPDVFARNMSLQQDTGGRENGILRNPDPLEKSLSESFQNYKKHLISSARSGRIIASMAPLSFMQPQNQAPDILTYLKHFAIITSDLETITGLLFYCTHLKNIIKSSSNQPVSEVIQTGSILKNFNRIKAPEIFNLGLNPETISYKTDKLLELITSVMDKNDPLEAEKQICHTLNMDLPTDITRATVNHPWSILSFALFLASSYMDDENALFKTALLGGESAALTACTASFIFACNRSTGIPPLLIENLINRKRVVTLARTISTGKSDDKAIEEFINCESSLSIKTDQEYLAQNKNLKTFTKQKQKKKDKFDIMSHPRPETWTKEDKARWKKEKRKNRNSSKNI